MGRTLNARKSLRGVDRIYVMGSRAFCPDCNGRTIIHTGSILGDLPNTDVRMTMEAADRVFGDLLQCQGFCGVCQGPFRGSPQIRIFWIELRPDQIAGPLCQDCFVTEILERVGGETPLKTDIRTYTIAYKNQMTQRAIDALKEHPRQRQLRQEAADLLAQEGEGQAAPLDESVLF